MLEKYEKTMEATQSEIEDCQAMVKKEAMASLLQHGADESRYGGLKSTLMKNMSIGTNQYPKLQKKLSTYSIPIVKQ